MKAVFFALITASLAAGPTALAETACPAGLTKTYVCTADTTAVVGENESAPGIVDVINVCQAGTDATLFFEKSGQVSNPLKAVMTTIPGSATYTIDTGAGMTFALQVPAAVNPSVKTVTGVFTISVKSIQAKSASNYNCDIK